MISNIKDSFWACYNTEKYIGYIWVTASKI